MKLFTFQIRSLVIAFLALCSSIFGQTAGPQQEVIRIDTNLVVLDAQVLNKKTNTPIGNLKPSDFALFENDIRQEITYFSTDKLPLSVVLLLDLSGSVQPFIDKIGAGAIQALQRLKPEDEIAIIAFAGKTQVIQNFTKNREQVVQQLQQIKSIAQVGGGTDIAMGIDEAAKIMTQATSPDSRRVIITVTDNQSYVLRSLWDKITNATLDHLFETGSVVCGLIVTGAIARTLWVIFYPTNSARLKVMKVDPFAEKTGGEMMSASKAEVDTKLGNLFEHLRARYSIGFTSTNTNYDGKFRRISLRLSSESQKEKREMIIKVRQGYYAKQITRVSGETK